MNPTGQVVKHGGNMQTDYTKQANDFLTATGIEFRAVLVGDDCPLFCEDAAAERDMDKVNVFPRKTHIHGKHYRCTLSRKGKGHMAIDFWNSYSDEEHNALGKYAYRIGETVLKYDKGGKKIPTAYDLLATIQKSDIGSFEDFCADFGYDTDSRRAESVYHAVQREWKKVRAFFTAEEIERLQEIQ